MMILAVLLLAVIAFAVAPWFMTLLTMGALSFFAYLAIILAAAVVLGLLWGIYKGMTASPEECHRHWKEQQRKT